MRPFNSLFPPSKAKEGPSNVYNPALNRQPPPLPPRSKPRPLTKRHLQTPHHEANINKGEQEEIIPLKELEEQIHLCPVCQRAFKGEVARDIHLFQDHILQTPRTSSTLATYAEIPACLHDNFSGPLGIRKHILPAYRFLPVTEDEVEEFDSEDEKGLEAWRLGLMKCGGAWMTIGEVDRVEEKKATERAVWGVLRRNEVEREVHREEIRRWVNEGVGGWY